MTLTAYPEDGSPVTVYADRANYDERSRESRLMGNVRWTDTDGSLAETEEAQFHPATRLLEAPGGCTSPGAPWTSRRRPPSTTSKERMVRFAGPIEGPGAGKRAGDSRT